MSRTYITPLGERIIEYGISPPDDVPEVPPYVDWVGATPRLYTADAGTSYLHVDRLQTAYTLPAAAIELPRLPNFDDALVHVQIRVESSSPTFWCDVEVFDQWDNYSYGTVTGATNEWITTTGPLTVLASGPLTPPVIAVVIGPFFDSDADRWDVSWVAVSEAGGMIPLRWRQRDDGLSGGPRQARGVSSQQMSNRHRGYL